MQNQVLQDDDCACFLVEAIAKKSQNIKWMTTIDSHKLIRRVSMDQFYELITGEKDAFYQLCLVLPDIISDVVNNFTDVNIPEDTVWKELQGIAEKKNISIVLALFLLEFEDYSGFLK